jgi:Flp pilus assembly protein TadD
MRLPVSGLIYPLVMVGVYLLSGCQTTPEEEEVFDPEAQGVTERMRHYRGEIAKTPDDPELHYRLGNALLDLGNYREAFKAYQRAVQLRPDYANAYANLGLALRRMGNLKAASGAYMRALDLKPDDAITLNNLAAVTMETKDWERMRWCYGRLLELEPGNLEYAGTYAALLYGLEAYGDAIPVYERLVAAGREPAANRYRLGYCHFALGQWDRAIETWEGARALSPENASVNQGLVAAYTSVGDRARAQAAAERCAALGIPLDPHLHEQLDALLATP